MKKTIFKDGLGPVICANLDHVSKIYLEKDNDFILVISGDEGSGKSTLAWLCCKYVDTTFNTTRIVYDSDDFKKVIDESERGQAIMLDEGGWMLFSREAMTRMNKEIVKILMAIRIKNLFVVICIPSFWRIDDYVRTHRTKGLIQVPCRGRAMGYGKRQLKTIYQDKRTRRWKIRAKPFHDSFQKVSGLEWDGYLARKREFVSDILKTRKEVTVLKYARKHELDPSTVYKMIKRGELKTKLSKKKVMEVVE